MTKAATQFEQHNLLRMATLSFILTICTVISGLFAGTHKTADRTTPAEPGIVRASQLYTGENDLPPLPDRTSSAAVASPPPDSSLQIGVQIGKHIRCIFQDKTGTYWFGTDGDGVCRYDGKSFTDFSEKDGLRSNFVRTIQEDKAGNIWFSTRDGICRFDGTSLTSVAENEMLPFADLGPNLEYKPGCLWFSSGDGVSRYDGTSFEHFIIHPASYHPEPNNLNRPYAVYCIFEDKRGNLWFGTEQRGVCRFDGTSFTWFTGKGLDKAAVRCILQDKTGDIWFVNNGAGVCRYDGKSLTNFTEEKGLGNPDFLKTLKGKAGTLARPFTIAEDDAGTLWFGTVDAGVWRYDRKSLTTFTTKDGLGSNTIWTIYKDKTGNLWFGTDGAGVYRFNGKSFINITRNPIR